MCLENLHYCIIYALLKSMHTDISSLYLLHSDSMDGFKVVKLEDIGHFVDIVITCTGELNMIYIM